MRTAFKTALATGVAAAALAGAAYAAAPLLDKTEGAGTTGACTVVPPVVTGENFCFPRGRDFAFSAHQRGLGDRATGFYTQRSIGSTGTGFRGEVTCLNVVGETAVFGGVFRSTTGPVPERIPFIIYVVDNGNARDGDPPDLISPLGIFPQDDPDEPLLPQGFPNVCPPPGASIYGYLPVTDGNIVVEDQSDPRVRLP